MVEQRTDSEQIEEPSPEVRSHSGCALCGSEAKAVQENGEGGKSSATTAVRFGYMRYIGEFSRPRDLRFTSGARVVVQTQRGIEIGSQVPLTCGDCEHAVPREQVKRWVKQCGDDSYVFNAGRILREATAADLAEYTHIQNGAREKRDFARGVAKRHELPIKVVECECLFGGERIIFHFTAAERVDFRAMVRDLAKEYRTRIEMRQIGARDEARLLADYETCGREVCCKVFLKTLKPISMRMAKLQKATLDPTQVSGRCGRLKCCLRYENIGYEALDKRLPRNGVRIRTSHGEGVVSNRQVLTQLVQIRLDDGTAVTVVAEDILEVGVKPDAKRSEPSKAEGPARRDEKRQGSRRRSRSKPKQPAGEGAPRRDQPPKPTEGETPAKPKDGTGGKGAEQAQAGEQPTSKRRRRRRRKRRPSGGEPKSGGGNSGGSEG